MIDTLRDSLATQVQISETLCDALPLLYCLAALLVVVVFLLIVSIAAQCQISDKLQIIIDDLYRFKELYNERHSVPLAPLYSSTRTWTPRKRHKHRKRRKIK